MSSLNTEHVQNHPCKTVWSLSRVNLWMIPHWFYEGTLLRMLANCRAPVGKAKEARVIPSAGKCDV